MPRRPIVLLAVACLLIAIALALGTMVVIKGRNASGADRATATGQPLVGGNFTMVNQDGDTVDQSMLNGKWSLVFFGFTYCPDYCPTTLAVLDRVQKDLGDDAKDLQIIFVTVDPQRDTPQMMKDYLSSEGFPQGVIGLTGTDEQVKATAKAYRAFYKKVGEGEAYTMEHTLTVYLMGPDGQFRTAVTHDLGPKRTVKLVQDTMKRG